VHTAGSGATGVIGAVRVGWPLSSPVSLELAVHGESPAGLDAEIP